MKNLKHIITIVFIALIKLGFTQTKKTVSDFNKVIISPHIETTFVQGNENTVVILENTESDDKVNIEVKSGTLRVYLDDAKETTKSKKVMKNGIKMKVPIYKGKVLTLQITYKHIDNLSLKGEQLTVCESLIDVEDFKLKIYGESTVKFNDVNFTKLDLDIYGESKVTFNKGNITNQNITAYGEGEVYLAEVKNRIAKLKAFGEAIFTVNTSEQIKFTAYGEAELNYKGNPEINRGLSFGNSKINQIK